jgi:putative photosynthetic complex assembly protein 2
VATILLWWGTTGVIAWLVGRSPRTYPLTLTVGSALATAGLALLWLTRDELSTSSAWLAFIAALAIWSWIELTFLTGKLTGPRKTPSAAKPAGLRHALDAIAAILWHELAILAVLIMVWLTTRSGANALGLYTLLLLWVMRSSAKLNLFLGVRNLGEVFFPAHLRHLLGYMRHRSMNPLLPFSLLLGAALTVVLCYRALGGEDPHTMVGFSLLAMLCALAVLEHALMVLPIRAEVLWRWSLKT